MPTYADMGSMTVDELDSGYASSELSLRLHPDKLDHRHVETLTTFTDDLQEALTGSYPRQEFPYTGVFVLLLRWEDDDLEVQGEITELRKVLEWQFCFKVEEWHIPSDKTPTRALQTKLYEFQNAHQSEQELMIVYYAGHGEADPRRGRSIWKANRKKDSPFLTWSSLQHLLETAIPNVLIILDCCFAANAARDTGEGTTKELLAACGRENPTLGVGERSFTSALIEELKSFGKAPFTVAMLHTRLVTMRWRLAYTPIYALLSENGGESIHLAPRPIYNDPPSPSVALSNANQTRVLLAISIAQDAVLNVAEWAAWLSQKAPVEVLKIDARLESVFDSHSTLALISIPTQAWDRLPDKGAYSFVGFVKSGNRLWEPQGQNLTGPINSKAEASTKWPHPSSWTDASPSRYQLSGQYALPNANFGQMRYPANMPMPLGVHGVMATSSEMPMSRGYSAETNDSGYGGEVPLPPLRLGIWTDPTHPASNAGFDAETGFLVTSVIQRAAIDTGPNDDDASASDSEDDEVEQMDMDRVNSDAEDEPVTSIPESSTVPFMAKVISDFKTADGSSEEEIGLNEGDRVEVIDIGRADSEADGWCKVRLVGTDKIGLVPVENLEQEHDSKVSSQKPLATRFKKIQGKQAFQQRKYKEAILSYSEGLSAQPEQGANFEAELLLNRAMACLAYSADTQALEDVNASLALDDEWSLAWIVKGGILLRRSRRDAASAAFEEALQCAVDRDTVTKAIEYVYTGVDLRNTPAAAWGGFKAIADLFGQGSVHYLEQQCSNKVEWDIEDEPPDSKATEDNLKHGVLPEDGPRKYVIRASFLDPGVDDLQLARFFAQYPSVNEVKTMEVKNGFVFFTDKKEHDSALLEMQQSRCGYDRLRLSDETPHIMENNGDESVNTGSTLMALSLREPSRSSASSSDFDPDDGVREERDKRSSLLGSQSASQSSPSKSAPGPSDLRKRATDRPLDPPHKTSRPTSPSPLDVGRLKASKSGKTNEPSPQFHTAGKRLRLDRRRTPPAKLGLHDIKDRLLPRHMSSQSNQRDQKLGDSKASYGSKGKGDPFRVEWPTFLRRQTSVMFRPSHMS